jgi:hypothetical protein
LIQTLDKAHSEMTSFAADAARDAEIARKNARKAQEIARRYENRSYPATTKPSSSSSLLLSSSSSASSFGGGPVDFRHAATNGYDHHSGNDSAYRTAGTGFDFVSSSSSTANGTPPTTSTTPTPARPRPPRLRPYHHEENDDDDDDHDISKDEVTTTTGVGVTNRQVPPHEQSQSESQIRTDPLTRTTTNNNHRATTTSNAVTPRRPIHTPPSSSVADRIAQHHAEDILQLNQELEKTKSALKAKERAHEECGITLNSLKAKNTSLEEQNHALLFNLEEERKRTSEQVADLQKALDVERKRVLEANEDADLAVDFAKASTEERNQFEHQLQQALEELQLWKERAKQLGVPEGNGIGNGNYGNHIVGGDGDGEGDNILEVGTPKRHVHFADQSAFLIAEQQEKKHLLDGEAEGETTLEFDTPRRSSASRPSRSMVAAGRQILRRNTATSPSDTVTLLELTPTKAAELRQRLRQRLVELEEDTTSSSSSTQTRLLLAGSPPTRASRELIHPTTPTVGSTKKKLDECYTAIKILQTSGRKLDLDGYWWRDYQLHVTTTSNNNNSSSSSSSNKGSSSIPQSEIQLDAMTRQYCQNVEVCSTHHDVFCIIVHTMVHFEPIVRRRIWNPRTRLERTF